MQLSCSLKWLYSFTTLSPHELCGCGVDSPHRSDDFRQARVLGEKRGVYVCGGVLPPCRSSRGFTQLLWGTFQFFRAVLALTGNPVQELWGLLLWRPLCWDLRGPLSRGFRCCPLGTLGGPLGQGLACLLCVCVCMCIPSSVSCLSLAPVSRPGSVPSVRPASGTGGLLVSNHRWLPSLHTPVKAPGHPSVWAGGSYPSRASPQHQTYTASPRTTAEPVLLG